MNSWVWDQVGLEFSDVDVEGTVESEGSGQRRDNLSDQSVKIGVSWSLDVQLSSADIIEGLVIEHDSNVGVLEEGVGGKNGVVWFNNGS